ncbi:DUF5706 domain-containing protein [Ichthyenterobacterium sp. W332]|uniref:DUF5706 domain-containing protein n=1 Tax=Microcosmobacter mediterraneus TaxID=3075607 RepID=A0ABU2YJK7_9FLAO|nr:Pycsar system effector family protein [Ichthyenterobacterium sp. W332]MDT0558354.1 DUF5706 domain-containing protein [Ichthyenterobacterium sp. W332]
MKQPEPKPTHKKDDTTIKKSTDLAFHYWGSINYFVRLIKSSELKAGLILSFYGIILNFVYKNVELTQEHFLGQVADYILLGSWLLCTFISIYFSIRTFIPRIEKSYDTNVFFFGDIISKFGTINEFSETFYNTSINEKERYNQLGQQIFINAKIAATKFKSVNKSLRYLAIGLILLLIIVLNYVITPLV